MVDSQEIPAGLSTQGRLVLTTGNFVKVRGKGFDRAGFAEVWLFSTPQLLGRVPKDATGNFVGRVRIPDNLEAGEHTIELRAVTKRAKLIAVSVPAIVLAGSSSNDTATTSSLAVETTTVVVDGTNDTSTDSENSITAPAAKSAKPIKLTPGATEVTLPIDTVLSVVTEILGAEVDPLTATIRVRVAPSDWQPFLLDSQDAITLPLSADSRALEIEVTPSGGEPIVRSIELVTEDGTDLILLVVMAAVLLIGAWWLLIVRRRRREAQGDLQP